MGMPEQAGSTLFSMDNAQFLQYLCDHSLEEGRAYIQSHLDELTNYDEVGNLIADEALRLLYTPFASLKLAELLISFGEYVHHPLSHALGLKAKGDVLMTIGHLQVAMECLDLAANEFLHMGDEGNWARSRISWIMSAAWLVHVDEALQEAERARSVFLRLGEPYWACVIDHNTALIYDYLGRYQDALKLYERVRITYPTLTDQSDTFIKRSIALAEMNQAIDLAWLGDFEQAYRLQEQARASFIELGEVDLVISAEINLADFDYTQGYYGSALRLYYHARDNMVQNNPFDPILLPEIKLCIAKCLVKLNRAQEACVLAAEAVEIYRQSGVVWSVGNALQEYATALTASGRFKDALAALDDAWVLLKQGKLEPFAYTTRLQRAELLLEMGAFAEAYQQANLVKQYFDLQGMVACSVRASLIMVDACIGNAQHQEGKEQDAELQEAMSLCKQASLLAYRHNLQEETYKSHYLLGKIWTLRGNLAKAARHYKAAIIQIENILDDLVYDLSPSFLHTAWSIYGDMIDLCLRQSHEEQAFNYLEQARSMALRQYLNRSRTRESENIEQEDAAVVSLVQANNAAILRTQHELRDEQENHRNYSVLLANIDSSVSPAVNREIIQQELKQSEAKISELFERLYLYQSGMPIRSYKRKQTVKHAQRLDSIQVRQSLSAQQLLLAYFLSKEKLTIFAVTKEHLIAREIPDGMKQLERLLPLLYAHLDARAWSDLQKPPQQFIRRLLNKLYQLLIAPVEELLPDSGGLLTIVPFGPLHKLPFHALHDGSRFLIEDYQVNYLPTSGLLLHPGAQESHESSNHSSSDTEIASAKVPLVFGFSGDGYLQRVHDEAETVAALLDGHCYLEDEATIARLIEQAPGSPIIHLATHGESRLDAPNFSYVRLTDGQLNAIDAFSLDLRQCELVTLSGCETGLALTGGGDEQLGLGRAFLAAGATSMVMSLWPVEDNATNELMKAFYRYLLAGESRVQALRAAQCDFLHQTESIYIHPYFWAAFRLVGEIGSLRYTREKKSSLIPTIELLKKESMSVSIVKK
jgi:CHAT domain-containing protein